jgi:hypothetical protein
MQSDIERLMREEMVSGSGSGSDGEQQSSVSNGAVWCKGMPESSRAVLAAAPIFALLAAA